MGLHRDAVPDLATDVVDAVIADLIAYLLTPRLVVMPDYTDNTAKATEYLRRVADYRAADPDEFKRRYLAGLAVQKRVRQGKRKDVPAMRRVGQLRGVK